MRRPPARAVLFDIDDTLVQTSATWLRTLRAACGDCSLGPDIDFPKLGRVVFRTSSEMWKGSAVIEWCEQRGIGADAGLLSDFTGDGPELEYLRSWAPDVRLHCWQEGLASIGVTGNAKASALAQAFVRRFHASHVSFDDVASTLTVLQKGSMAVRLAVVSNGASDTQRGKLRAAGLDGWFQAVLISGELGVSKPGPDIFRHAASQLGVAPEEAVMVGDRLEFDVQGALNAGLGAVWLNRSGTGTKEGLAEVIQIDGLSALPRLLGGAEE